MNLTAKYHIIFLLISICVTSNVLAQQNSDQEYTHTYYIKDITYVITGSVTEAALTLKLSLKKDIAFDSQKMLLDYIYDKRSRLKNLRQLTSSSTIVFNSLWNEQENRFDVILTIHAIADWTIFALPYFKYSDNSGLLLSGRGRDYNFLGSLETLRIDLNYTLQDTLAEYELSTSFKYPIKINEHIITPGIEETLSWQNDDLFENKTKFILDYAYPITSYLTFLSGASQRFISRGGNTEQPEIYSYANSVFYFGSSISLNKSILPIVNIFVYSPKITTELRYPLNDITPIENNAYSDLLSSFSHDISFGRVDWIQNLRQGISVSLGNEIQYQKSYTGFNIDIDLESQGHLAINDSIGLSTRAYFVQNFYHRPHHEDSLFSAGTNLATRIRGVLDDKFGDAISGMAFNMDILFNLFSLRPLLVDEVQLGIFSDVALRKQYETEFNADKDIKVTAGITVIIFSIYRSLHLRASLGSDILQAKEEQLSLSSLLRNRELFIGLNLFY